MNNSFNHGFEAEWSLSFPQKIPISYLLKYYFSENWLRLYSLSNAKRYAKSDIELKQLLHYQNQIISDCFSSEAMIYIVSGHYSNGNITSLQIHQNPLNHYNFEIGTPIHLYSKDPKYFDDGENNDQYFTPHFAQSIWQQNLHNELLIKIANDEADAFFISFEKNIIIAPYDGGIDLIIADVGLINQLKRRYSQQLSYREDGL